MEKDEPLKPWRAFRWRSAAGLVFAAGGAVSSPPLRLRAGPRALHCTKPGPGRNMAWLLQLRDSGPGARARGGVAARRPAPIVTNGTVKNDDLHALNRSTQTRVRVRNQSPALIPRVGNCFAKYFLSYSRTETDQYLKAGLNFVFDTHANTHTLSH